MHPAAATKLNSSYSAEEVYCYVLTFWPGQKNAIQGDAPEGSDTF